MEIIVYFGIIFILVIVYDKYQKQKEKRENDAKKLREYKRDRNDILWNVYIYQVSRSSSSNEKVKVIERALPNVYVDFKIDYECISFGSFLSNRYYYSSLSKVIFVKDFGSLYEYKYGSEVKIGRFPGTRVFAIALDKDPDYYKVAAFVLDSLDKIAELKDNLIQNGIVIEERDMSILEDDASIVSRCINDNDEKNTR